MFFPLFAGGYFYHFENVCTILPQFNVELDADTLLSQVLPFSSMQS